MLIFSHSDAGVCGSLHFVDDPNLMSLFFTHDSPVFSIIHYSCVQKLTETCNQKG